MTNSLKRITQKTTTILTTVNEYYLRISSMLNEVLTEVSDLRKMSLIKCWCLLYYQNRTKTKDVSFNVTFLSIHYMNHINDPSGSLLT